MSKMIIKCLFGQAKELYEGEHAPELIVAVDEWTLEDNPDYWEQEKARALANDYASNFVSIREIDIEVDQDKIRSILLSSPVISGEIK